MKNLLVCFLCLLSTFCSAHNIDGTGHELRQWHLTAESKMVEGSFYMFKQGNVYIEDAQGTILNYPLSLLIKDDQTFALNKAKWVESLNQVKTNNNAATVSAPSHTIKYPLIALALLMMGSAIYVAVIRKNKSAFPTMLVGASCLLLSFSSAISNSFQSITNPQFIDSAFTPFKPAVYTRWDTNYFYVESKGIPSHEMMTGITNWQRQLPIPQCYTDNNAWSIPLNPALAATPVPVNQQHFLRGAVAIAVNGVAIFNPYTNTGADAYLTGQLDSFGGHCGRADDYHYHIAPLSLYSQTSPTLPIAFALDGFAIYGNTEPEGGAMTTLDANHGHYGTNGVYHYHGTASAPYMIGNMVGKVTEDTTLQIVPQAQAHPVRQGQDPLPGAVISHCHANSNSGYTLIYSLNGNTDSIVYSWNTAGVYTFNFYTQGNLDSTRTYNGFVQCNIRNTGMIEITQPSHGFTIVPNPAQGTVTLHFDDNINYNDITSITIYNYSGVILYQSNKYQGTIDLKGMAAGPYLAKVITTNGEMARKFIIQ